MIADDYSLNSSKSDIIYKKNSKTVYIKNITFYYYLL